MAEWQVALISGGAAVVSGIGVALAQWATVRTQYKTERRRRRADERKELYRSYLQFINRFPVLIVGAVVAGNPAEVHQQFRERNADFEADLLFYASKQVSEYLPEMRKAVTKWLDEEKKAGAEDVKLPIEQRQGVDGTVTQTFRDYLRPALEELARRMRLDDET